jgi:antibiotic biosynthesis monooxygenase (ABM) superfamily enzyme
MNNNPPKKWKMMLLTWLFVYPVINILFALLFPLIQEFNQFIKTLILTLILVPLMGVVLPKLHNHFGGWLRR